MTAIALLGSLALVAGACSEPPRRSETRPRVDVSPSLEAQPADESGARRVGFVSRASSSGVNIARKRSWGVAWVDSDANGYPELFVNRHFFDPLLFVNRAGAYERSSQQEALARIDRHGCAWGEANGDGIPDLFCGQGAEVGHGEGPNQLFIQDADGTLHERAAALGIDNPRTRTRSVNWLDFDRDGDLDVFTSAHLRKGFPNRMFENKGGRFEVASVGLAKEMKGVASSWADWDLDGDPDLVVTRKGAGALAYENRGGRFVKTRIPRLGAQRWLSANWGHLNRDRWPDLFLVGLDRAVLLLNRRGTLRVRSTRSVNQGRAAAFFDVDNDTDSDVYIVQGARGKGDVEAAVDRPDILLLNRGGDFDRMRIRASGPEDGNGDDVAVADHDLDGRLDLFVTNGYKRSAGEFVLLENDSDAFNSAGLHVNGNDRNPLAFGVRAKVTVGGKTYWRSITDGVSFRSQYGVGYLHLGLGAEDEARVSLRWPNGARNGITVRAGQIATISPP